MKPQKASMEKLAGLSDVDYRLVLYAQLSQTDASIRTLSELCNTLEITLAEFMDPEESMQLPLF